jgi:hypothetical protein
MVMEEVLLHLVHTVQQVAVKVDTIVVTVEDMVAKDQAVISMPVEVQAQVIEQTVVLKVQPLTSVVVLQVSTQVLLLT